MPAIPIKTEDIVVAKIEEKKMKKGVDNLGLVWYINRAPAEGALFEWELSGEHQKV